MDTTLSGSPEAIKQTALAIRRVLNEQWEQHMHLYLTAPDAFVPLTDAITHHISDGRKELLHDILMRRHHNLQAAYDDLQALVNNMIDYADQMAQVEQTLATDGESL